MLRTINFIMVCTSIAGLISVYALKYSGEETAREKVKLERRIENQRSQLSELEAGWAYLNQPAHIGPIVARHAEILGLSPTKPEQFGTITDLPMRPVVQNDTAALDELFESLEAGVDPIELLIQAE
jgi:hypothetical protein